MKKLFTVLSLGAFLATAAAGCKKKEEAAPAPAPAEKKAEEAPKAADPAAAAPTGEAKPADPAAAAPTGEAKPADPAAAAAPAAGSTGIAACDEWVASVEKLSKCDKVPAETAKGLQTGLEGAKSGWGAIAAAPADQQAAMKTAAETACKGGVEGVKAAMTAAGCQ